MLLALPHIYLPYLTNEAFILREQGSDTRIVMEKLFRKHKISPKVVMELGSSEAVKRAIIANIGLSLVSKTSIEIELLLQRLIALPVKELPLKHFWYAVYLKDKQLSPLVKRFLVFLKRNSDNKVL